jgi:hypothetical protein
MFLPRKKHQSPGRVSGSKGFRVNRGVGFELDSVCRVLTYEFPEKTGGPVDRFGDNFLYRWLLGCAARVSGERYPVDKSYPFLV